LQYGACAGHEPLLQFCKDFTELVHKPNYSNWDAMLTCGNTEGLNRVARLLFNRGDKVILDEFSYSTALETFAPLGVEFVTITMDDEGMEPNDLKSKLENWDTEKSGIKPKVIFLVPCGQNPTGATQSVDRRKAIYAIAQDHNLVIVEDDPYYFLQMNPYEHSGVAGTTAVLATSHQAYLDTLVPSYLRFDVDGRVIRLESFSKILAPGLRLGWIVCNKFFMERVLRITEVSSQAPSGLSQSVVAQLLLGPEGWKMNGWLNWLIYIRQEYTTRRNALLMHLEKLRESGHVSYVAPTCGMFVWLKVNMPQEKLHSKTVPELVEELFLLGVQNKVLVVPGTIFAVSDEVTKKATFIRVTFAMVSDLNSSQATARLAETMLQFCKQPDNQDQHK